LEARRASHQYTPREIRSAATLWKCANVTINDFRCKHVCNSEVHASWLSIVDRGEPEIFRFS
jgi:hypothetical protein